MSCLHICVTNSQTLLCVLCTSREIHWTVVMVTTMAQLSHGINQSYYHTQCVSCQQNDERKC